ncbi:hypothetical protein OHA98_39975 [Streptomyces sp. NBC_00654]|uniref:hypothetical protein n=1 Tax=Streptomyces sp. NBC_00654 TaxID=2975799 RepID=UPI0022579FBD|nr:hypothetical protein [Streptomyces sp. NBC_00654]MCX4970822.1 hypothetical protein [Streptomyces sp. NBC_00654]
MAIIGVRVEFYEEVGDVGESSQNMLGALYRERGFKAEAVPRVGELFRLSSLRVGSNALPTGFGFTVPGPFLPVRAVEHSPVPIDDRGNTVQWWDQSAEPLVSVVLYTTRSDDPRLFRTMLERFAAPDSGWNGVFAQGTELDRLWGELRDAHSPAAV